nr:hypothetical protein [Candidatus Nanosyncoccus alces]
MATVVKVIRARMSAVSGRNHIVATHRAFDKVAERQEVFAMCGFLVLVAGRLDRAAVFSKHVLYLVEFFFSYHWFEVWRYDTQVYAAPALFENSIVERIVEDAVRGAFADAVASDMLISAR